MGPESVAVVLPVFRTERLSEVVQKWRDLTGFKAEVDNVAFDMHYYHCFGEEWEAMTLVRQFRACQAHRKELLTMPGAVVGEWSLALGDGSIGKRTHIDAVSKLFGRLQLAAYEAASHGWFFWTWKDAPHYPEWDFQECVKLRWLVSPVSVDKSAIMLPHWQEGQSNAVQCDELERYADFLGASTEALQKALERGSLQARISRCQSFPGCLPLERLGFLRYLFNSRQLLKNSMMRKYTGGYTGAPAVQRFDMGSGAESHGVSRREAPRDPLESLLLSVTQRT